jgi:hypothetical protein
MNAFQSIIFMCFGGLFIIDSFRKDFNNFVAFHNTAMKRNMNRILASIEECIQINNNLTLFIHEIDDRCKHLKKV